MLNVDTKRTNIGQSCKSNLCSESNKGLVIRAGAFCIALLTLCDTYALLSSHAIALMLQCLLPTFYLYCTKMKLVGAVFHEYLCAVKIWTCCLPHVSLVTLCGLLLCCSHWRGSYCCYYLGSLSEVMAAAAPMAAGI